MKTSKLLQKLIILLCIMSLGFVLTACDEKDDESAEKVVEDNQNEDEVATDSNDEDEDEDEEGQLAVVDSEPATDDSQDSEVKDENNDKMDEIEIDLSMPLDELLASLDIKPIDQLYYELSATYADGTTTLTKNYVLGENLRMESESEYGNTVLIYNADEGIFYSYSLDDMMGMSMTDVDEEEYSDDLTSDEVMSKAKNIERMDYNGYDVIYYEVDEEGATMKVWFSLEYAMVIKSEITFEEGMMTTEVTYMDLNPSIDKDLFVPDEGVQFMDESDLFNMIDMATDLESLDMPMD